ncbi:MAG: response regulator, partial [Ignavibacteriaceae bacterium]
MENSKAKILIVEDENITALDLKKNLQKKGGLDVYISSNGLDAIMKVEKEKPDIILMDIMLKGHLNGIDVADIITKRFNIPIIYLSAYTDDETVLNANATKPFAFLGKPFDEAELN